MWARAIDSQLCITQEPSDDVRLAILRAKDRADSEKSKRRGVEGVDNDIKSMTKLVLLAQLKQMGSQVPETSPSRTSTAATGVSSWTSIEFDDELEMWQYTLNFFYFLRAKRPDQKSFLKEIHKKVVLEGRIDINMMLEDSLKMKLWVEYFWYPSGRLMPLRRDAIQWRRDYRGLTEENWQTINRIRKQREEQLAILLSESSRFESDSDGKASL